VRRACFNACHVQRERFFSLRCVRLSRFISTYVSDGAIYLYIRFRWSDLSLHTFQMELVDILGAEFSADPSIKNKLGELAEGT